MKKLVSMLLLLIVQQTQAILVNYTKLTAPNGKIIHLFGDMQIPNNEIVESQTAALTQFLLENSDAALYIEGINPQDFTHGINLSRMERVLKETVLANHDRGLLKGLASQGILAQTMSRLAEFALKNKLQLKADPRVAQKRITSINEVLSCHAESFRNGMDRFETKIFCDCLDSNKQNIIIFAGLLHTIKLEKLLKNLGKFRGKESKNSLQLMSRFLRYDELISSILVMNYEEKALEAMENIEKLETFIQAMQTALYKNFSKFLDPLTTDELAVIRSNEALTSESGEPEKNQWSINDYFSLWQVVHIFSEMYGEIS